MNGMTRSELKEEAKRNRRPENTRLKKIPVAVLLIISVFMGFSTLREGSKDNRAAKGGHPVDPSIFEVRQQGNEITAFFPVDAALARRWVPPEFELLLDAQGKATGAFMFLDCPKSYLIITPNGPALPKGENTAPACVIHVWFMLKGPDEVLPVPGAKVTRETKYAYALADLVTSPLAERVYKQAGKNAILIAGTKFADEGNRQTAEIIFKNRSKITLQADTPTQLPAPLILGGHWWTYSVDRGDVAPASGKLPCYNKTRVMFLGLVPGPPLTTRITIHAEAGTCFVNYYGTSDVITQGIFVRLNNIVNNSSCGELVWTTNPPYAVPVPPALPPSPFGADKKGS